MEYNVCMQRRDRGWTYGTQPFHSEAVHFEPIDSSRDATSFKSVVRSNSEAHAIKCMHHGFRTPTTFPLLFPNMPCDMRGAGDIWAA